MIYDKLFDWQKNIVDKIESEDYGLFLDMGLGKTIIALALAEKNNCSKILIIAPNNKVLEDETVNGSWLRWKKELDSNYVLSVKNDAHFDLNQNDFYMINYESLYKRTKGEKKSKKVSVELTSNINQFIDTCKNHNVAIIIDESHRIKDLKTSQTKAIMKIKRLIKVKAKDVHCYLLTGTPFTTGYIDLYSQLKFLDYPKNKSVFESLFCVMGNIPGLLGWQQPIIGYKNIDALYKLVHEYAITIKSETVQNLPEQIFIEHKSNKTNEFKLLTNEEIKGKEVYKEILRRENKPVEEYNVDKKVNNPYYRDIDYDTKSKIGRWYADTTGSFWMRCRQLSIGFNGNVNESKWFNSQRLDELKDFLINNEDNYVIFYNYTPELLAIYDVCEELGYDIDVYCGEIKSLIYYDKYSKQTEAEKLSNKKNVIIANFASGSEGKNWQEYNKCILFSLPLYKDYAQSLKRVHRTGQTKTVFYHIFYQDNWLDREMYKSLKEGVNYSEKMFESDLNRVKELMEDNK